MRPINLDIPLQGQRFFDQLGNPDRKEKPSPLKQPGYFHHEDSPSGMTSGGMASVDEGRLQYAINGLFHPDSVSPSTSSWSDPLKCTWYITETLKASPIPTVIKLINSLPCYDNPNDLFVVTLLGTLEEEKLKSALIEGLKLGRIQCSTRPEKFIFKQLGKKIVPDLTKLLEHKDSCVRFHVYYVFGLLGKDASESIEILANKAKNDPIHHKFAANAVKAILDDMNK